MAHGGQLVHVAGYRRCREGCAEDREEDWREEARSCEKEQRCEETQREEARSVVTMVL
jgi:hypothetical protein